MIKIHIERIISYIFNNLKSRSKAESDGLNSGTI